jgi:hypothetical protein
MFRGADQSGEETGLVKLPDTSPFDVEQVLDGPLPERLASDTDTARSLGSDKWLLFAPFEQL